MYDLVVSYTSHFHEKNTESSVIFLRNDVLIFNGKENKEASAICFEIRIPKKKERGIIAGSPIKNLWSNFTMEKNETKIVFLIFPNIITEQWGSSHDLQENHFESTKLDKVTATKGQ